MLSPNNTVCDIRKSSYKPTVPIPVSNLICEQKIIAPLTVFFLNTLRAKLLPFFLRYSMWKTMFLCLSGKIQLRLSAVSPTDKLMFRGGAACTQKQTHKSRHQLFLQQKWSVIIPAFEMPRHHPALIFCVLRRRMFTITLYSQSLDLHSPYYSSYMPLHYHFTFMLQRKRAS